MCLAPRYMNTSRWVPVLFFRNAASSSATPCAMAVVAISNSATKARGTRHLWLASSSRRVGEWKGMHVSGTGLGSASGADIAAAYRSEEHTSEPQSLMRITYAAVCLKQQHTTQKR